MMVLKSESEHVSCSVVSDSATPWTVACQVPLSMEFSRRECWSGFSFPSPGSIPKGCYQASSYFYRNNFTFLFFFFNFTFLLCLHSAQAFLPVWASRWAWLGGIPPRDIVSTSRPPKSWVGWMMSLLWILSTDNTVAVPFFPIRKVCQWPSAT